MIQYNSMQYLPPAEDLPDSNDTPVDNELQIPVPSLLRAISAWLWAERQQPESIKSQINYVNFNQSIGFAKYNNLSHDCNFN